MRRVTLPTWLRRVTNGILKPDRYKDTMTIRFDHLYTVEEIQRLRQSLPPGFSFGWARRRRGWWGWLAGRRYGIDYCWVGLMTEGCGTSLRQERTQLSLYVNHREVLTTVHRPIGQVSFDELQDRARSLALLW